MPKRHRNDPRAYESREGLAPRPEYVNHRGSPDALRDCALRRERIYAEFQKRHSPIAEIARANGISRQRCWQIVQVERVRRIKEEINAAESPSV